MHRSRIAKSHYKYHRNWLRIWKIRKKQMTQRGKVYKDAFNEAPENVRIWWNIDYEKDIFEATKVSEQENRPIMMRNFAETINFREQRSYLLALMRHISAHESLSRNALHLGVYLMDMFVDKYNIPHHALKFIAGVCLILAAKMEDRDSLIPTIPDFDKYLGLKNPTSISSYAQAEFAIMRMMNFKLVIPTAVTFVDYFACALVTGQDFDEQKVSSGFTAFTKYLENANLLLIQLLDATLEDVWLVQEIPSRIAAACILAVRTILNLSDIWTPLLAEITQYRMTDLIQCASKIISLYEVPQVSSDDVIYSSDSAYFSTSESPDPVSDPLSFEMSDVDQSNISSCISVDLDGTSDESMSVDE
ncbi:cyclin-J [Phlebotomus argentipes]|uniref:cyclin-J n=1 Tax=Phlebotomus argentipes TaxID=94469 RepID=UPI00289374E9|nr:cyclin-J [Phlebotomus argentipes]